MTASTALVRSDDAAADPRLPAPVDKSALRNYLALLEDPEALKLQNRLAKAYDTACAALIGENDVQVEGARSFKKKSAWKKLARYFSISTTVLSRDERFVNDEASGESVFVATCTVRAVAPWGQFADAVGACGTDEETGRRKITIADAIGTAETRASNRATSNLIAMGEVSAEEASRDDREQLVRRAAEEMTLDEARLVKFPWRKPEKYADQPLEKLSLRMLNVVKEAVEAEITKSGETPRRVELKRAAELMIVFREQEAEKAAAETAASPATPALATETAAPSAASEPIDTRLAPGKIEDALDKPAPKPPTMSDLAKSISKLLQHEKLSAPERADFLERSSKAASTDALRDLIGEIENIITSPV